VIGSVFPVSGYAALGRGEFGAYARTAPGGNAARLLDGAGATLQALDNSRSDVGRIKQALTTLRDALQAAREQAGAVAGRTELKPVVAEVEQTRDKPTYVTIDGAVVQDGTITVSLGPRPLVVGYERANRAPLDVRAALNALSTTVTKLVSRAGADAAGGFAADVSALLRSDALTTAVNTPDAAAIDTAIGRINDTLAKAAGLGSSIGARAAAAAQVDLGGLLLSAAPDAGAGAQGAAGASGDSP
jgi:hypothetical protein